jgi:hypothetical protein
MISLSDLQSRAERLAKNLPAPNPRTREFYEALDAFHFAVKPSVILKLIAVARAADACLSSVDFMTNIDRLSSALDALGDYCFVQTHLITSDKTRKG